MSGIFGVIGCHDAAAGRVAVRSMADAMARGGRRVSATYENVRLGSYVGWVQKPGRADSPVPIWNAAGDVCLIFSGEDFRDRHEMQLPGTRGEERHGDHSSYLLRSYEEVGERFLESINGWFCGLLLDLRQNRTLLFNDRYGLGRVYVSRASTGLFFASEAKALLRACPDSRQVDDRGLAEVFSMGCVLQNRTLFRGIALLPPAAKWSVDAAAIDERVYFSPSEWQATPQLTYPEYYERLKDVMARIVPRYCAGSERVGMSLTGGLDGRLIMAWANAAPGSLPCYTFGGIYRDCEDVKIARRVAKIAGQPHQVIPVGAEFLREFPKLAEETVYVSDGAMDVSGAVELYANRVASEIAPVRLTGNYGSEIIRRNVAFRPAPFAEHLLTAEFAELVRGAASTYAFERTEPTVSFIAFKQTPWHHFARLSVERSEITLRSPYLDNELVALMHRVPDSLAVDSSLLFRLVADGVPQLADLSTDRGLRHRPIPVATQLERFWRDFTVKAEYAYDHGMPRWLARVDRLLKPLQPERLFLGRNKFYHFRVWYRDLLIGYVKEILLDSRARSRSYLNGSALETMVDAHAAGRENYTTEIHTILSAELLHRTLIEQAGL